MLMSLVLAVLGIVGVSLLAFVDWLTTNYEWFFDGISNGLRIPIEGLVGWLEIVPPFVFIVVATLLAFWLQRSWRVALFILVGPPRALSRFASGP